MIDVMEDLMGLGEAAGQVDIWIALDEEMMVGMTGDTIVGMKETLYTHIGIIFFLPPLGTTIGGQLLVNVNVGAHQMVVLIREMV